MGYDMTGEYLGLDRPSELEYGCVRCQKYHGQSDGPVYAAHLYWQSKHGTRRRPKGGWLDPTGAYVDDGVPERNAAQEAGQ